MFGQMPPGFSNIFEQLMPQAEAMAAHLAATMQQQQRPMMPTATFPPPAAPVSAQAPASAPAPVPTAFPGSAPARPVSLESGVGTSVPRVLPSHHSHRSRSHTNTWPTSALWSTPSRVPTLASPSLSCPSSVSFCSFLPLPHVDVPRNSLTTIGHFLYTYQFQLMRLIPFISRLADLFQRESLMVYPHDRVHMQVLAQNVGQALHEIVYATAPVAHLIRDVQIGEEPGSFRLVHRPNPDLVPFVNTYMVGQNAAPRPGSVTIPLGDAGAPVRQQAEERIGAPNRLSDSQERELTAALQQLKRTLSEFATTVRGRPEDSDLRKARAFASLFVGRIDTVRI